jgi:hypothetical protein
MPDSAADLVPRRPTLPKLREAAAGAEPRFPRVELRISSRGRRSLPRET